MKFWLIFVVFIATTYQNVIPNQEPQYQKPFVDPYAGLPVKQQAREQNYESGEVVRNQLKADSLGELLNDAMVKHKESGQEKHENSDATSFEHFLNSNSIEEDALDLNEDDFELPQALRANNPYNLRLVDDDSSSSDDDSLGRFDGYEYYDYPEIEEYWLVPYDPEAELDRAALEESMAIGAVKPAQQQNLVIVHETVNVGKIEVNQVPKALEAPPLADQGIVVIQPDITQIQENGKSLDSQEEFKRADDHAHQKQIQPPRFLGGRPSSEESEAKEVRKLHDKQELLTEMDHDLEPVIDDPQSIQIDNPLEFQHRFLHYARSLTIVDVCVIILTVLLILYVLTMLCQFAKNFCRSRPIQSSNNKVAPVILEQPLPAKEVKVDLKGIDD